MAKQNNRTVCGLAAVFAATAAGLGLASPSFALTIIPTFDSTITGDTANTAAIEAGITAAIDRVDAAISNNITDNVTFSEMSTGLGQSSTVSYTNIPYATYVNALETQQTLSANDITALASLGFVNGVTTTNPVNGDTGIHLETSIAKALGIANFSGTAATISLNTSIMNLSRTGPQNGGFYDIQAVAGHELDEVLGIGGPGSSLKTGGTTTGPIGDLDLYRYSSPGVRSYSTDGTLSPEAYFSINGGLTDLVHFDQNSQGADFSDWGNGISDSGQGNNPPQLQDSNGGPGAIVNIGTNELTALDVIGYNLTAVPEPTSMAIMAVGAGLALKRRRRCASR